MSHEIDRSNGRANFAFNSEGGKPWHRLGVAVPGLMTVSEALTAGGLDFEVTKRPIFVAESDDEFALPSIRIPRHFATVRTDSNEPLGVVGANYTVVQNRDALKVFDPLFGEGQAIIETVGSLKGGRRAFMLAKVPEVVEIVPGDAIERYLLFSNSHDVSSAVEILFTPVRVVCQNTLSVAIGEAKERRTGRVSIRHTASARARLETVGNLLDAERDYFKRIRAAYAYMAKRDVKRADVAAFVSGLFPGKVDKDSGKVKVSTKTRKRRQDVVKAFEESPGSDKAGDTGWGLFNAATWFIDHERKLPKGSDQWEASVIGSGVDLRQKAFDLALAL